MFQLGHFVPKLFAHFLSNTSMGVAKWERDLWWLSLFLWKCEVKTTLTISNGKTALDGNWEIEWVFHTHQPKVKKIFPKGVCCLLVEVELEVGLYCGQWLLDNNKLPLFQICQPKLFKIMCDLDPKLYSWEPKFHSPSIWKTENVWQKSF